jgi:hypothetical protein
MRQKLDYGSFWFEPVNAKENLTRNFVFSSKYVTGWNKN